VFSIRPQTLTIAATQCRTAEAEKEIENHSYIKLARRIQQWVLLSAAIASQPGQAETFVLPPSDVDLVGALQTVTAKHEDTLLDIARRFDVGQDEMVLANPAVDRWLPGEGAETLVPTRFILPQAKRTGIVLNVPEMRLYFFPTPRAGNTAIVQTYPVSIGRMDWATPLGTTAIAAKTRNPSWRPPESIRSEHAADGSPLPEFVPPGPDNPLGNYALRLTRPGYLIHGTNRPYGVGMRVTHGCVRMYPEDIEALFPDVPVGTPVQIVNQPIKLGWLANTLFIEVHPPLDEQRESVVLMNLAMDLVNASWEKRPFTLNGRALKQAVEEQSGIPVAIADAR
jgi:L,D-transpeptidase ErfK/SrfK